MNIAIIGQMASGKTTSSNYLVDKLGFKKISLAEPIYWIINNLYKEEPSVLFNKYIEPFAGPPLSTNPDLIKKFIGAIEHTKNKIPREEPKPRKQLQWLGTEGGRNLIDKNIWIKILLNRVKKYPEINFVIDDVRFKNELTSLENEGFLTVKLEIDKKCQLERLKNLYGEVDESVLSHGSEVEIKDLRGKFTIYTCNNSLEETFQKIDNIVRGGR